CVNYLNMFFANQLMQKAIVCVQNPVRMGENSEPQPGISLLKFREDYYRSRHPQPGDVYLIVEVVASTAEYDRKIKIPLYAKHGVMELWIVDLEMRAVEVFRHPTDDGYVDSWVYRPGDALSPQAFPDVTLKVEDILG
ncbi:Uma2 family endonuclease, partial [bacterium]|nr:Uma2 family endonuclease [bacterium]